MAAGPRGLRISGTGPFTVGIDRRCQEDCLVGSGGPVNYAKSGPSPWPGRPRGGILAARHAAITGLGMTSLGRGYGLSPRRPAANAVRPAAAEGGKAVFGGGGLLIWPGISDRRAGRRA